MVIAEILATDPASVKAACDAGADRIELCAALGVGGVTPGPGLLYEALRIADGKCEVVALVRPWAGDFCLRGSGDLETQIQDVRAARKAGASGVAVGVLSPDGTLDEAAMKALIDAASPLPVTLHRAIDAARDYLETAELAIKWGVARILTSGGAATAWNGRQAIAELVRTAGKRVEIMAGAGVRSSNAQALLATTGAGALHGSCSRGPDPGGAAAGLGMGFRQNLDPVEAAALVSAAHGVKGSGAPGDPGAGPPAQRS